MDPIIIQPLQAGMAFVIPYAGDQTTHLIIDDRQASLTLMLQFKWKLPADEFPESGWTVTFDSALLRIHLSRFPAQKWLGLFRADGTTSVPFSATPFKALRLLLENLMAERSNHLRQQYISLILSSAAEAFREDRGLVHMPHPVVLEQLDKLIEMHFRKERQPAFYAKALGFTKRKLNPIVRGLTGHYIDEMIKERLLAEAEHLLADTDLLIEHIAHELGFNDQSQFNYFFSDRREMSPTVFREKAQHFKRIDMLPSKPGDKI